MENSDIVTLGSTVDVLSVQLARSLSHSLNSHDDDVRTPYVGPYPWRRRSEPHLFNDARIVVDTPHFAFVGFFTRCRPVRCHNLNARNVTGNNTTVTATYPSS